MRKFLKYFLLTVLFLALSVGSGFFYVMHNINTGMADGSSDITETDELVEGGRTNILLLGVDAGTIGASEEHNRKRSDTMIVFSIDKKNKEVKALSIPRDTRIRIPGVGIEKINAAMAFGGPSLAVKTVKDLLGVPIHNYVVVDYKALRKIVDTIGGVEIDIERKMDYDDYAGNLHIHFKPGLQKLDGKKAEKFVRYREYPNADIDRIKAQQKFIAATAKTLLKPANLLKLPKIIDIVQENVKTDIGPLEMVGFANMARQISMDDISMYMLPGEGRYISHISYFIPNESKINEVVDEVFFGDNIRVEVLNGNGSIGIASKIAEELESKGFKVVKIANADNFDYEVTTILYPKEKKNDAEKIAEIFAKAQLKEEMKQEGLTTVIIGKDIN